MDHRNLGKSGLKVSPLCLGAMTFGEADSNSFMHNVGCDAETARAIMNKAVDSGVNFIDTADVYGQDGLSERVIGGWFERDGRRDETVLATKMRFRMSEGPNGSGASRRRIMQACEESLKRLKTDRIDLYQIHMQDMETPEEETIRALDDLVRQGKVLYIGASNYAAYRFVESMAMSEMRGWARFVSLQVQYSLLAREVEREHVPACERWNVGVLPWSPLAAGFLSGKYKKGEDVPTDSRMGADKWKSRYQRFDKERNWAILDAVLKVANETESSFASVSLAWLMAKPCVTSVIFGARTIEQLDDNLGAAEIALTDEQVAKLDEASAFDLGYPYEFMRGIQGGW